MIGSISFCNQPSRFSCNQKNPYIGAYRHTIMSVQHCASLGFPSFASSCRPNLSVSHPSARPDDIPRIMMELWRLALIFTTIPTGVGPLMVVDKSITCGWCCKTPRVYKVQFDQYPRDLQKPSCLSWYRRLFECLCNEREEESEL
jgi:hypothetical protein